MADINPKHPVYTKAKVYAQKIVEACDYQEIDDPHAIARHIADVLAGFNLTAGDELAQVFWDRVAEEIEEVKL